MKRCNIHILSCGSCAHPEAMTRKGASLLPAGFPSLVGVIRHPQAGIILFDTGYDRAFFAVTASFPEKFYRWTTPVTLADDRSAVAQLKHMGIAAEDVSAIIISHFHADHVAGLHQFKNAKIFCAKAGLHACLDKSRFKLTTKGILAALIPSHIQTRCAFFEDGAVIPLPAAFIPFTTGVDMLGDGSLIMVELPGHCPGHWGMICKSDDDQFVFFIADAAWSITAVKNNTPPPAITTFLLGNTQGARRTLSDLHVLAGREQENIFILPSHCETSINLLAKKK